MIDVIKSSALALYFDDWGCALVHDKETDEWTMEFDDDEQELILLESPDNPFVGPLVIPGTDVELTETMFLDMKLWLESERQRSEDVAPVEALT